MPTIALSNNDIVGKEFGKLTVLLVFYKSERREAYTRCACSCGKVVDVLAGSVKYGKTKSCGCLRVTNGHNRLEDISGNRYGRLVSISFSHRKANRTFWKCLCDCGNEALAEYSHLVTGRTKSCGCIKKELMSSKSGESSHLWRGGASYKPWAYPKEWNDEIRESIRNRDNRLCQFPECTYSDVGKTKRLDVHHIDGNKQDCRPINLISLCHSHHMKVEMSPRTWEDYFYSVVSDYEHR